MSSRERGFIFLFTLTLIAVMALLSLTLLQHVLLYHKAINRQERQHQLFYQMELLVRQLAHTQNRTVGSTCIVDNHAANKTLQHLTRHKGCSLVIGNVSYQYLIEDLGLYPCLVVHKRKHNYSTHHVRISLMSLPNAEESASALQVRVIKPTNTLLSCPEQHHFVTEGISSWRYFAEYNKNSIYSV